MGQVFNCGMQDAMIMGADYYESDKQAADLRAAGHVPIGIGAGSTISNTIVDKNARIGHNCQIVNKVRGQCALSCTDLLCCEPCRAGVSPLTC